MKQKISNRILSVLNILGWVAYLSNSYYEKLIKGTIEVEWSKLAVTSQQREIITLSQILFVVLSAFLIQVFQRTENLWRIIPIIAFTIALIVELIMKRRKKIVIIDLVGIAVSISLAFINMYNNIIWLVGASIVQFIFSENFENESKSKKIFNSIILGIVIAIMMYGTFKYIMLINDIKNIDAESKEFFSKIERKDYGV